MLTISTKKHPCAFFIWSNYSTADETKLICYVYKGPLSMNYKLSADRNKHVNNFTKLAVSLYSYLILTRFKPS